MTYSTHTVIGDERLQRTLTTAERLTDCPECEAPAGVPCHTPATGHTRPVPHHRRMLAVNPRELERLRRQRELLHETIRRIADRDPDDGEAADAFFRSRQDAQEALQALAQ